MIFQGFEPTPVQSARFYAGDREGAYLTTGPMTRLMKTSLFNQHSWEVLSVEIFKFEDSVDMKISHTKLVPDEVHMGTFMCNQ